MTGAPRLASLTAMPTAPSATVNSYERPSAPFVSGAPTAVAPHAGKGPCALLASYSATWKRPEALGKPVMRPVAVPGAPSGGMASAMAMVLVRSMVAVVRAAERSGSGPPMTAGGVSARGHATPSQ